MKNKSLIEFNLDLGSMGRKGSLEDSDLSKTSFVDGSVSAKYIGIVYNKIYTQNSRYTLIQIVSDIVVK